MDEDEVYNEARDEKLIEKPSNPYRDAIIEECQTIAAFHNYKKRCSSKDTCAVCRRLRFVETLIESVDKRLAGVSNAKNN